MKRNEARCNFWPRLYLRNVRASSFFSLSLSLSLSWLSRGRFPIGARLHVKISARSVYFRRKTRESAEGSRSRVCLRACARQENEERKCTSKQFHGQHTARHSAAAAAAAVVAAQVEEGKRLLLHRPRRASPPLLQRTYPIPTQSVPAQPCASRAQPTRVKHVAPRELPATIKSAVAYHLL